MSLLSKPSRGTTAPRIFLTMSSLKASDEHLTSQDQRGDREMKALWSCAACFVVCVIAIWCSRTTYGDPPKALPGTKMISLDDAILDANEILFIHETQTDIEIGFRGLPSQGNGGYTALFVRKTPENWRTLAAATGVAVPPRPAAGR
jgi:hypothetical protein